MPPTWSDVRVYVDDGGAVALLAYAKLETRYLIVTYSYRAARPGELRVGVGGFDDVLRLVPLASRSLRAPLPLYADLQTTLAAWRLSIQWALDEDVLRSER